MLCIQAAYNSRAVAVQPAHRDNGQRNDVRQRALARPCAKGESDLLRMERDTGQLQAWCVRFRSRNLAGGRIVGMTAQDAFHNWLIHSAIIACGILALAFRSPSLGDTS